LIQTLSDKIEKGKSFLLEKIFDAHQKDNYSIVEKIVTVHMTLITKMLYQIDADNFKSISFSKDKFYKLILDTIS
jgi:hypothetical protein